ncbi:MAG: tetratricopeptide repeat protein [Gemmatimonadota bacterium]|nr:tetratricopeptide repeat protein [Gemmatimonadota bacterium]
MRSAIVLLGLVLSAPLPGCAQDAGSPADPREAYQRGDYERAARGWEDLARREGGAEAYRGRALALAATGEYETALRALDEAPAAVAVDGVRGRVLRRLGRLDDAEAALRRAARGDGTAAALARLELAELLHDRGEREEAFRLFDGFIDLYNGSPDLEARSLTAVGTALTYLGARDSDLFHDAVRAYDEAIAADPGDPEPRVRLAALFLDKYDSQNAGALLDEALARNPRHPEGLLTAARRAKFEGSSEALELTERALEVNPRHAGGLAFQARLYLDLEDVERAEKAARAALEVNPVSLEAWTGLAAAAHLRDDETAFAEARERVLALDPAHAALYEALAEVAYRTHRYADAVRFAEQAVALDSLSWSALATLGLNQLRIGEIERGRATLETAFAGDPFNVWVKNTLDLLDELSAFETTRSERFVFRIHPDEAGLLSVYAPRLAEEAFDALAVRYAYRPPTPISVEIYDRHADFSVRTVGLAGIGALGVSFGSVLAMDSPGARPPGEFNWGSTLWHEISHAFTLGYTGHRVPRWLSEGLAVLDERHARQGWGADVDPGFLFAFREDRLPSLERFNYGFVRPAYPGQVQHSYYLASLLCEMIESTRGFDAILRLLDGYRDGLETPQAVEGALGTDLDALDEELRAWVETRFATALQALGEPGASEPAPDSFAGLMVEAARARSEGRVEAAVAALERARALFPEYAGPDAPTLLLGRLHRETGDLEAAAEAYGAYAALDEDDYEARIELADVLEALDRPAEARRALADAIWMDPFAPELHERLARAYEQAGAWREAVRERRALLALEPVDAAGAHFRLARAHHRAGDAEEARRAVLRSLEIAPSFAPALDLLLEIRGDPEEDRR